MGKRGPAKGSTPKCNIVSFRMTDKQLELAIKKAGGRARIGSYVITELFYTGEVTR